jgi:hypothetical protein
MVGVKSVTSIVQVLSSQQMTKLTGLQWKLTKMYTHSVMSVTEMHGREIFEYWQAKLGPIQITSLALQTQ